MFCQNCGAELRLEAGFCAVCGASAPRPALRHESDESANKAQRLNDQSQRPKTSSRAYDPSAGSSLFGDASPRAAPQPDPRQIRSFQAIRQASGQRGSMRALAPAASLAVPPSPPSPDLPQPEAREQSAGVRASQAMPAQPPEVGHAPAAAPIAAPAVSPAAFTPPTQTNHHAPTRNTLPAMPALQNNLQVSANGYHPTSPLAPGGPIANGHTPGAPANGHAPQQASTAALFMGYAPQAGAASAPTRGFRVPRDLPNRLALLGLLGMFLSFLLPWVIISGSRTAPLSIGWPVVVPLAVIFAVACTILLPERTVYTRFFLALPFAFGCAALGSALVVFLVSSAIAANSVGITFLGVDIGFILFTLAALLLAVAGYFKFLRELPLLYTGQITLAPLPGTLGRPANPAPRPSGQQPMPNGFYPVNPAAARANDQRGPSA
jgi:hypothetical protein